ncbi:MAG: hypothetical protein RR996_03310 [Alistipes sp.]
MIGPFEYDELTIYTTRDPTTGGWIEVGQAMKEGKSYRFTLRSAKAQ